MIGTLVVLYCLAPPPVSYPFGTIPPEPPACTREAAFRIEDYRDTEVGCWLYKYTERYGTIEATESVMVDISCVPR